MQEYMLSQSTIEKLGYYVYLLIDPKDNKIFYVGKGKGNRINQHLLGALDENTKETDKIKLIRGIQESGQLVKLVVLRHELTEDEAFEIESAVIDLLGKHNLTNIVQGHKSEDRGAMSLENIKIKYQAEDADIQEPVILININRLFQRDMSQNEIYNATRMSWSVSMNRVERIRIACSVFRGVIREVFMIDRWLPSTEVTKRKRYMFEGLVAPKHIRDKYINKSVSKYWKKGSQYPTKYVNA